MSSKITRLTVGQLQENCFLVSDKKTHEAIIIDPGDEAEYIIQKLSDLDTTPISIVATHGHFDHIQAALELQLAYNIPFLMHQGDLDLLKHYRRSAKYYTDVDPGPPPKVTHFISTKDTISLGETVFEIIEVPGHTPGSVALYSRKEGIVFVGDVIFEGGVIGRTDLPYSNKKQLLTSIEKLLKLPRDTIVYSGHGDPTSIGDFTAQYRLL